MLENVPNIYQHVDICKGYFFNTSDVGRCWVLKNGRFFTDAQSMRRNSLFCCYTIYRLCESLYYLRCHPAKMGAEEERSNN